MCFKSDQIIFWTELYISIMNMVIDYYCFVEALFMWETLCNLHFLRPIGQAGD